MNRECDQLHIRMDSFFKIIVMTFVSFFSLAQLYTMLIGFVQYAKHIPGYRFNL